MGIPLKTPIQHAIGPSGEDVRMKALSRSKTTLNVPTDARERITPQPADPPAPGPLSRSKTSAEMPPSSRSPAPQPGPVRGLSVRRPGTNSPQGAPPLPPAKQEADPRLTEFYDDYLNSYTDEAPPPLPKPGSPSGPDRIAAWARSNANPSNYPLVRSASRSAPASQYAPSSFGGGTMRRKLTRRGTSRQGSSRITSSYEEEEEGYVSGEYEDAPFELVKIRIKVRIHLGRGRIT